MRKKSSQALHLLKFLGFYFSVSLRVCTSNLQPEIWQVSRRGSRSAVPSCDWTRDSDSQCHSNHTLPSRKVENARPENCFRNEYKTWFLSILQSWNTKWVHWCLVPALVVDWLGVCSQMVWHYLPNNNLHATPTASIFWSPPPTFAIAHLPFGGNEQLPTGVIVIPVVVVVVGATYRPSDFGASVGRTLRGVVKAWLVVVLSPNEGVGVVWSSGDQDLFRSSKGLQELSFLKSKDLIFYMNLQGLKESSSSTNNLSKIIKILR